MLQVMSLNLSLLTTPLYFCSYPAQFAVISVLGLLLELLPLFEHFGVRKGDSVDPLEGFHVCFPLPVSRRILVQHKRKKKRLSSFFKVQQTP